MSFLSNSNGNTSNAVELQQGLLSAPKLDSLTEDVTRKLDLVNSYIAELDTSAQKIGTTKDTKAFRDKMKSRVDGVGKELKYTKDLVEDMEHLPLSKASEVEKRQKILKRVVASLNEATEKFSKVTNLITTKERQTIALEREVVKQTPQQMQETQNAGAEKIFFDPSQIKVVNFNEALINERQEAIDQISKVAYQVKDICANVAMGVQEQGEQVEILVGNIQTAKENTKVANKELVQAMEYQKRGSKTLVTTLSLITLVCAVVVFAYWMHS